MAMSLPSWMYRMRQQDEKEESEYWNCGVIFLKLDFRIYVWLLCGFYKVPGGGVMGQACNIIERYMGRKLYYLLNTKNDLNLHNLEKRRMRQDFALLASIAISLASKMVSTELTVDMRQIRIKLKRLNMYYTARQIQVTEWDILSIIQFYVPIFTNTEKALLIAKEVGMPDEIIDQVMKATDIAEIFRSNLQDHIFEMFTTMTPFKYIRKSDTKNIWHLHLVSGAVIAAGVSFGIPEADILHRVAVLTNAWSVYLSCIARFIYERLPLCPRN